MAAQYPLLPAGKIVAALQKNGFEKVSQRGSHLKMRKQMRTVIILMHQEVARGTLRSILEQAGLQLDEVMRYI